MNLEIAPIELLQGYIRCNPLLLIIDFIFIVFFLYSWHKSYKTTGFKIDIWHIVLFRFIVVPVFLIYPTIGSIFQQRSIGLDAILRTSQYTDYAFLLSLLGFTSMLVGRYIYNHSKSNGKIDSIFYPLQKIIQNNIRSKNTYLTLILLSFSILLVVTSIVLTNGQHVMNPRSYFQNNGALRPLYNICIVVYPLTITVAGLRLIEKYSNKMIEQIMFGLIILFSIFLGTRSAILDPIFYLIVLYYMKNNRKISYIKLFFIGLSILLTTSVLLFLRSNKQSFNFGVLDFFYGNTFSDTRDFAHVMAYWDKELLLGKSYLAGIISFIPRFISEYREQWALGVYTAKTVGHDPAYHPGLRPGIFGESYFNFGIPGVIFLGLTMGFFLRHIDYSVKQIMKEEKDSIKSYSYIFIWALISCLSISVGFSFFYFSLILLFSLAFIRQVFFRLHKK